MAKADEVARVKELLDQGLTLRELRWEKFETLNDYDIQDVIREYTAEKGKRNEFWGF